MIGVPILLPGVDADPEAVHEALKGAARKRPSRDLLVRRLIERTMRGFRSSSSNGYPLSVPEMRVGIGPAGRAIGADGESSCRPTKSEIVEGSSCI